MIHHDLYLFGFQSIKPLQDICTGRDVADTIDGYVILTGAGDVLLLPEQAAFYIKQSQADGAGICTAKANGDGALCRVGINGELSRQVVEPDGYDLTIDKLSVRIELADPVVKAAACCGDILIGVLVNIAKRRAFFKGCAADRCEIKAVGAAFDNIILSIYFV